MDQQSFIIPDPNPVFGRYVNPQYDWMDRCDTTNPIPYRFIAQEPAINPWIVSPTLLVINPRVLGLVTLRYKIWDLSEKYIFQYRYCEDRRLLRYGNSRKGRIAGLGNPPIINLSERGLVIFDLRYWYCLSQDYQFGEPWWF